MFAAKHAYDPEFSDCVQHLNPKKLYLADDHDRGIFILRRKGKNRRHAHVWGHVCGRGLSFGKGFAYYEILGKKTERIYVRIVGKLYIIK
ncbi:hypothetical protein LEP1GSC172_4223 [Leptospira noguchii]|uniref:Uncharacterized protein n=1 Tax=Leptospira noguchii TaxID=28182 RepID=M6VNK3_9LEPT|nr:hypothetical protein LEP1GSC172_4223 [Leptospira noguchii]